MHDYEIFLIQLAFMLPILGVWMDVCDWDVFRGPWGSYWTKSWDLNRLVEVFTVLTFCKFFQVVNGFLAQFLCLASLGLWSCLCTECIRSTILIQISCIHELKIWFFKDLFSIFFKCSCANYDQFAPNLSLLACTRNLDGKTCTKRFKKLRLAFFMYLF